MAAKTLFTLEDYLALDEPDGPHHELSEGELLVTPSTTITHNEIQDRLRGHLRAYLALHPVALVTGEVDFLLGPDTVRRPDVALILASRLRPEYRDMVPVPVPPDIVFEVISRHDRPKPMQAKVKQYLAAGTHAVWLIDPFRREAQRYRPGATEPELRDEASALEEPELLPGWRLPLRELFAV